jgi:hypothetical protein
MHRYIIKAPFKMIAKGIAGPLLQSDRGNHYLLILITMNYFTKWPEMYTIPNQEASTVMGHPGDQLLLLLRSSTRAAE